MEGSRVGNQYLRAVLPSAGGVVVDGYSSTVCGDAVPDIDSRRFGLGGGITMCLAVSVDVRPAEHDDVVPALPGIGVPGVVVPRHRGWLVILPTASFDNRQTSLDI